MALKQPNPPVNGLHRHILQVLLLGRHTRRTPFVGVVESGVAVVLKNVCPAAVKLPPNIGQQLHQGVVHVGGVVDLLQTLVDDRIALGQIWGMVRVRCGRAAAGLHGQLHAAGTALPVQNGVFDVIILL